MTDTFQDLPLLSFPDQKSFEVWLRKNHQTISAIWLKLYKKASGIPSISYAEAVDVSLCYGWIDSQVKSLDDKAYIQKFSQRKSRSPWSEINKGHVARLIKEGRMHASGLAAIEAAKQNGEWDKAYHPPTMSKPSEDFQKALDRSTKAKVFFDTLSKTQQFYFVYWIDSAKRDETKEKRIKESISMLERGEKRT